MIVDFVLSIGAAAAVAAVLGLIWYAPFGFGDSWLDAIARQRAAYGDPLGAMLGSFTALVVSAVALGVVLRAAGVATAGAGAWLGLLASVLVGASLLADYLFHALPLSLFAIQLGYRVAYFVMMGALLAVWR